MTDPQLYIRLNLTGCVGSGPARERCPECGSEDPLTVLADSDDWSTDPVQVMCAAAHSWLSTTVEAWHLASIVAMAKQADPEFVENTRRLAELQADGTGPA